MPIRSNLFAWRAHCSQQQPQTQTCRSLAYVLSGSLAAQQRFFWNCGELILPKFNSSLHVHSYPRDLTFKTLRKRSNVCGRNCKAWAWALGAISSFSLPSSFIISQTVKSKSWRLWLKDSLPLPWVPLWEWNPQIHNTIYREVNHLLII